MSSSSRCGADVRDPAVLEQGDPVGEHHRRRAVRDDQAGRGGEHPAQRLLDQLLGVHVQRGERVVEDQDLGLGEDRAGQREPLPLAAGEGEALLADAGVEPPGQVVHELGLGDLERLVDLRVGGRVGVRVAAEGEVLPGAHREQRRVLERGRHQRAEVAQVEVADVDAVDQDPAAGDVEQPRDQGGQDGLAGAGRPDDRDGLARRELEVDPAQHLLLGAGEREVDVPRSAAGPRGCSITRVPVTMSGSVSKISRIAGRRRHRLLCHRQDHAERGHRPDQREHQGDEGDQLAGGQLAAADADRTEQQHDAHREVGDHLEEGPEPRRQPDLVHARRVQLLGGRVVLRRDVLGAAEGLDHPDADGALLGAGREVALLVLDAARDDDVGFSNRIESQMIGHGGRRDHQPERPVHVEQHDR